MTMKHKNIYHFIILIFILINLSEFCQCLAEDISADNKELRYCTPVILAKERELCIKSKTKSLKWKITVNETLERSFMEIDNISSVECRIECMKHPDCTHVTYNINGHCWLGSSSLTYSDNSYNLSSLHCCREDEIPVDSKNAIKCYKIDRYTNFNSCESDHDILNWITEKNKTFVSNNTLALTSSECRRKCAENSQDKQECNQITFSKHNNTDQCWLVEDFNVDLRDDERFDTQVLHCCEDDIYPHYEKNFETLFDCLPALEQKEKCYEIPYKFLLWKTEKHKRVDNCTLRIMATPEMCRRRCALKPMCREVTYNDDNSCWLCFGYQEVIEDENFHTSVLNCCRQHFPTEKNNLKDCEEVSKMKIIKRKKKKKETCIENEYKFPVWKTRDYEGITFDMSSRTKLIDNMSFHTCQVMCHDHPNCTQFSFSPKAKTCLLGTNETIDTDADDHKTVVLFCCQEELKLNVKITTDNVQGAGTSSRTSALFESIYSRHDNCKHFQDIPPDAPNEQGETYEYNGVVSGCPKLRRETDFSMTLRCDIRDYYINGPNWSVKKVEVQIGEMKICFRNFDIICKDEMDKSTRGSKFCDYVTD